MPIYNSPNIVTPPTHSHRVFAKHLAKIRRRTASILWIERLAPSFLPAVVILSFYIFAGLLRFPQSLPDSLRLVLLLIVIGVCAYWTWRRIQNVTPPTCADIDRRIEQASHLSNTPLATLEDTPVQSATPSTRVFWALHQQRILASLGPLRSGYPSLLPCTRTGKLCFITIPTLLVLTMVAVGPTASGRILAAFIPGRDDPDVPFPHLEAWITPPRYTSSAPLFLTERANTPLHVPENAQLNVVVSGLRSAPYLRASQNAHLGALFHTNTLQHLDAQSWKLTATLIQSGTLRLTARGRTLSTWYIVIRPDAAPLVQWGKNPGARKGEWRTALPYHVSHAYGLSSVAFVLHATQHLPSTEASRTLTIPLPFVGHPNTLQGVFMPDLSTDPWAGQEVTGIIIARSVSGKEGKSNTATFRLGARVFHSPLARTILGIRNRFALGQESRTDTITDLETLAQQPTGLLHDHTGMLLNLVTVIATLHNKTNDLQTARLNATNLLWDLAQDIEEHATHTEADAQASLDVRAAQASVAQQLAKIAAGKHDPATQAALQTELETRLQTLHEAIRRKMQIMAAQATLPNDTPLAHTDISSLFTAGNKTFSHLLDQVHAAAANGHPEEALKRLQDIENVTEQMRRATPQDLANLSRQIMARQQAQEQMNTLKKLIAQQMSLLDRVQARQSENQRLQNKIFANIPPQEDLTTEERIAQENAIQAYNRARALIQKLLRQEDIGNPPNIFTPDSSDSNGSDDDSAAQPPSPPEDPVKAEQQAHDRHSEQITQQDLEQNVEKLETEFHTLTGKTPDSLASARDHMQNASHALATNNDTLALQAETNALEALNKTQQEMRHILRQGTTGRQNPLIFAFESGSKNPSQISPHDNGAQDKNDNTTQRDPLGRSLNEGHGRADDDSTLIPDTTAQQKARDIEQELRRRDSDRTRPKQELDYLDRLLKPF